MPALLKDYIERCASAVGEQLESFLPAAEGPAGGLYSAMRYSVLNGGKRIRPLLCFAAAEAVGEVDDNTVKVAAAVEMIHAYSLIHDDLPAMDDDDLRRGVPTCHIAYDEATAILAGDGLQTLAFQQLTELDGLPPSLVLELVALLARNAGGQGMVGGQAIDLAATGRQLDLQQLQQMHAFKTGALIEASVLMGAMATNCASQEQLAALGGYAKAVGLAFQIQDDILDIEGSTEQLGKQQGSDLTNGKATYTSLLGLQGAREAALQCHRDSCNALALFGDRAVTLRQIADYIVERKY